MSRVISLDESTFPVMYGLGAFRRNDVFVAMRDYTFDETSLVKGFLDGLVEAFVREKNPHFWTLLDDPFCMTGRFFSHPRGTIHAYSLLQWVEHVMEVKRNEVATHAANACLRALFADHGDLRGKLYGRDVFPQLDNAWEIISNAPGRRDGYVVLTKLRP